MLWIAQAVRSARPKASPSDFLVFGLGYDSAIWAAANCGGTTVFLENMASWIKQVTAKVPGITVHQVSYSSNMDTPEQFFKQPSEPVLPEELDDACFDVVLVDSPMGWKKGAKQPGRFQPVCGGWGFGAGGRCGAGLLPVLGRGGEGGGLRGADWCGWQAES